MHVHALKEKASNSLSKENIKQAILNICAFNPTPNDLDGLSDCECFPVAMPSGNLEWVNSKEDFAIIDRREYGEMFFAKIKILDFSLEELHSMKPFLLGLRLDDLFMSGRVEEQTKVEGGFVDERLTNDLRRKAYAICR